MRAKTGASGMVYWAAALALCLALPPSTAMGQSTLVELGVDGMIERVFSGPGATLVQLPIALFRIGAFTSPRLSWEPSASLEYSAGNGHFTTIRIGVGALWHFTESRTGPQPYIRPFVEDYITSLSLATRKSTESSAGVGLGVGVKLPLADRLRWRLEGAYESVSGEGRAMGLIGLSFFTR